MLDHHKTFNISPLLGLRQRRLWHFYIRALDTIETYKTFFEGMHPITTVDFQIAAVQNLIYNRNTEERHRDLLRFLEDCKELLLEDCKEALLRNPDVAKIPQNRDDLAYFFEASLLGGPILYNTFIGEWILKQQKYCKGRKIHPRFPLTTTVYSLKNIEWQLHDR